MYKKRNLLAQLLAGLIFLEAGFVAAQTDELKIAEPPVPEFELVQSDRDNGPGIEGSWAATVSPDGDEPFQALLTFERGGSVTGSAQGDILLEPPSGVPPGATPVHGAWKRTGNNKYLFTVRQIYYGAEGSFAGGNKIRNLVILNSKGDQMSGNYRFDVANANGNTVFSGTGTIRAVRIKVEPLIP